MNENKKVRDKMVKSKEQQKSRRNYKRRDRDSKVEDKDFKAPGCNDISWYAQDTTLLRNVANFPWSTQSGLTYDDANTVILNGTTTAAISNDFTSPGILALHVLPGLGNTAYQLDAVNVAANAMYVFIRHMNSGAKNYDAPDLMNYILAMDEVYSMINFCQRLYGTLGMYSVYNRYTPETLIKMQGIDPEDLRDNMVQFRYRLNTIIKQAATLVVPSSFPIFLRHAFLFQDYYIEGNDMKDQIYMYTPINFREFNIPAGGGPGELIYTSWDPTPGVDQYRLEPGTLINTDMLLDKLQSMVSRIYLDEDFGIMAGDILKAYGESGVVRLSELPDAYVCTLKQNNEVLLQMKNANMSAIVWRYFASDRSSADTLSPTFGHIVQDPNTNRISENLRALMASADPFDMIDRNIHMLTLEGEPSPEMNMIMSRLIHGYSVPGMGLMEFICGTEIVAAMTVCRDVDPFRYYTMSNTVTYNDSNAATSISNANIRIARSLSVFKYHPCVFLVHVGVVPLTAASDVKGIDRCFQIDNFTIINDEVLDRLNQVAIMSEFNVPHMALIS